jgi:hypothetical protein
MVPALLFMAITNQITPNGQQPYANQMSFGALIGRVNNFNKSCNPSTVQNMVNDVVRRVYDRRNWYGNFTKGQIISPGYYSVGRVSLTFGSNVIVGSGTSFTPSLVGQQLRVGFTAPIYSITAFIDATHLQLEMPWGMPTQLNTSYFVTQYYFSFPNIKFFVSVKNLMMMYRLWTNCPQSLIENWDPSRLQMMWPRIVATMPPDASGNYQIELWPAPNVAQAFPYLAYIQPPNLVDDLDNLPAFIRADIIQQMAIAEVLLYEPKKNPGYSETVALEMSKRFSGQGEMELQHAMEADEALYRADIVRSEEQTPYAQIDAGSGAFMGVGGGGFLACMSPVSAYGDDY